MRYSRNSYYNVVTRAEERAQSWWLQLITLTLFTLFMINFLWGVYA